MFSVLFPAVSRSFPGMRWLNIALRTLHLVGVAGLGGAYLYEAPRQLWEPYLWLSFLSGFSLITVSLYT